MSVGCDLVEAASKLYADGAQSLEKFAKQIRDRYGDKLPQDVLDATFKKAADRYRQDYRKLDQIRGEMARVIVSEARKSKPFGGRAIETALNVSSLPRSVMASGDFSMTLRQALAMTLGHPGKAAQAFGDQVRAMFGSRKYGVTGEGWAEMVDKDVKSRENAPLYERAGLYLAPLEDQAKNILQREEAFQSNLVEKIPVIRNIVGASNRAAVTYLNKLRADVFDDLIKRADPEQSGLPLEDAEAIASYINDASGRGKLPETLEKASGLLSNVFFSPRLAASRIRYLAGPGRLLWDVGKNVRDGKGITQTQKLLAFEYAKTLGAVATILGVAKMAGAEVETDPRSSDFLKIKVGNTRYDVMGGMQQYMVFAAKEVMGASKSAGSGKVKQFGEPGPNSPTRGSVALGFARSKLSPATGLVADALSEKKVRDYNDTNKPWYQKQVGSDFIGRPTTPESEAERMLIPLVASDVFQSYAEQEGVPKALLNGMLSALGMGVQTFRPNQPRAPEAPLSDAVAQARK